MAGYYCDRVTVEGDVPEGRVGGTSIGTGRFDEWKINASYKLMPYGLFSDAEMVRLAGGPVPREESLLRYCTVQIDPANRAQTVPSASPLIWDSDSTAVTTLMSVTMAEMDVTIEQHEVPLDCVPWLYMRSLVGKTNLEPLGHVDGPGYFPAGTLVYLGSRTRTHRMANQELACNVGHRFKFYPYGANSFYRWDHGEWRAIVFSLPGRPSVFPRADLSRLFRPRAPLEL